MGSGKKIPIGTVENPSSADTMYQVGKGSISDVAYFTGPEGSVMGIGFTEPIVALERPDRDREAMAEEGQTLLWTYEIVMSSKKTVIQFRRDWEEDQWDFEAWAEWNDERSQKTPIPTDKSTIPHNSDSQPQLSHVAFGNYEFDGVHKMDSKSRLNSDEFQI